MFLLEALHVLIFMLLSLANVMLEVASIRLLLRCKHCNVSVCVGGTYVYVSWL